MRTAALSASFLLALAACTTTSEQPKSDTFLQPNSLMAGEIDRRVEQIPYQHREELLQSLLWLAQTGEQTVPALLKGLQHENTKVRSSCAWVLGRIGDRRTIPNLQQAVRDSDPTVRLECARTLVLLGDLSCCPALIEGLDSERKEVRYLCHEALKSSTGRDFSYDHLSESKDQMQLAVLRWRQWWSDYSGDAQFAQSYQQKNGLQALPAQPMGETQNPPPGNPDGQHAEIQFPPPDKTGNGGAGTNQTVEPNPAPARPNGGQ